MKNNAPIRIFSVMLLGIMGASIGALIYFWGSPFSTQSQAFVTTPEFVIWFFINDVLFAIYPILLLMLWRSLSQLREKFRHNMLEILGASIILFGLYMLPLLIGTRIINMKPLPLEYADAKMLVIETVGFLVSALPLTVGIWLTQSAIRDTFRNINPTGQIIETYISLRDYLQQFLLALGALLSLFVLASAALRSSALVSGATTLEDYPAVYLFALGAYYTLLIAIIYFPAYLVLVSAGRRILDFYFPLSSPDSKDWVNKYAARKQLEDLLELKVTGTQRFLTSITLIAPFVSSILSSLLSR
jgi:hypothetical protein